MNIASMLCVYMNKEYNENGSTEVNSQSMHTDRVLCASRKMMNGKSENSADEKKTY